MKSLILVLLGLTVISCLDNENIYYNLIDYDDLSDTIKREYRGYLEKTFVENGIISVKYHITDPKEKGYRHLLFIGDTSIEYNDVKLKLLETKNYLIKDKINYKVKKYLYNIKDIEDEAKLLFLYENFRIALINNIGGDYQFFKYDDIEELSFELNKKLMKDTTRFTRLKIPPPPDSE